MNLPENQSVLTRGFHVARILEISLTYLEPAAGPLPDIGLIPTPAAYTVQPYNNSCLALSGTFCYGYDDSSTKGFTDFEVLNVIE